MNIDITVPSPGESVSSGILAKWLKPDGATVAEGDDVFELETDKATMAVPAKSAGILHHRAPEGAEVNVGDVVAVLETDGESSAAPKGKSAKAEAKPESEPEAKVEVNAEAKAETKLAGKATSKKSAKKEVAEEKPAPAKKSAPSPADPESGAEAKSEAESEPVSETQAEPKPAPSATPAPERRAVPPPPAPSARPAGRQTRERMTTLRKRIAENLVNSQRNSAHLSTFNEVDLDRYMIIRKNHGEAFEKRHGVKLGFMSIFVRACSRALTEFPGVNAVVDGEDIVFNHYYNIGVAVSTDRGLIVPVLRDADQKNFAQIETEIRDLAVRAREKRLNVDDLTGGTFTITNGGVFGSLLSTPIPTPPQTAILGMHTIQKRAMVVNDAIVIRPMMYVALTYDHRVIDGREAVSFLVRVKQIVEDPNSLLFDL